MNHISVLNSAFADILGGLIDIIPKLIYFMFAAFASGVDAMQALIRKLAGLDTYYVDNAPVANQDPLTEFVYGILGIGDSAPVYRGLNTVFWSLAIFGLIILVVSTIIAIIKSHYNEDADTTNPWKYIYTALKSIFTFVLIPIVVVVGMQLSTFVLKTLDNITGGQASSESLRGIYGAQATEIFHGEVMAGDDEKVYGNYDLFGLGTPTSSTTFGGMLFKASAYSANRARRGEITISGYQGITYQGKIIFGDASNCTAYSSLQTSSDRLEYIAYQVDYAFSNCLELESGGISYIDMVNSVRADSEAVRYFKAFDLFRLEGSSVNRFAKYDISLVWLFYNLWTFNYVVGFGGAVTLLGIILSIIIGLMMRLIKGAALFLVYPALLGIAPLDNFNGFKSSMKTFLQQILMAFGAIVGINLVLLILPYLQNIAFFNIGVVDTIVNLVLLIAGLMMAKDFITMMSGFIGGADAAGTGEGLKGGMAGAFKKGASITAKAGMMGGKAMYRTGKFAVKAGVGLGKGVAKVGGAVGKTIAAKTSAVRANLNRKTQDKRASKANEKYQARMTKAMKTTDKIQDIEDATRSQFGKSSIKRLGERAYKKALLKGRSLEDAEKAKEQAMTEGVLKRDLDQYWNYKKLKKKEQRQYSKAEKSVAKENKIKGRADAIAGSNNLVANADGKYFRTDKTLTLKGAFADALLGKKYIDKETGKEKRDGKGILGDTKQVFNAGLDVGKTLVDGILKSFDEFGQSVGIDKMVKGLSEILKNSMSTKWVAPSGKKDTLRYNVSKKFAAAEDKKEGDALQKHLAEQQKKATDAQTAAIKDLAEAIGKQNEGITELVKDRKSNKGNGGNGTPPPEQN